MPSIKIPFPGASGAMLSARLDEPAEPPRAYALFAHCFTCSKDLRSVRELSASLSQRGIAVLRFDFTGLGESDGDFSATDFSSNLDDLVAAADFLRSSYEAPSLLIGHSLGGAACLAAASRIPEVKAVATLGAPSSPEHLRTSVLSGVDPESESTEVSIAGRPFRIRRELLRDLSEHNVLEAVTQLRRALLILHSPVDQVVGIDHARRIYEAARHPKSFVSLDGVDHLLLERKEDAHWVGGLLGCWVERYLEPWSSKTTQVSGSQPELPEGVVEVVGGPSGFAQAIRVGNHRLVADEPVSVGGGDTGPDPYGLLLAGLGACTSMTLRMYAERKGWPLAGVRVLLRHAKIHAEDCETCETKTGQIDKIDKELFLEGDLDEGQRQRLIEMSERCPVHRTLTSEILIRWAEGIERHD